MYAGVVRCNLNQNDASVPVWALSASEGNGGKRLRIRCSTATADGINTARINEDTSVEVFDGHWHHVALTLSQSNGQTTASIYRDYEATPSWSKTVVGTLYYGNGYAPVWIGASSSATAFFNGQIDELRISRGILASTEFLRRGTLPFVIVVR